MKQQSNLLSLIALIVMFVVGGLEVKGQNNMWAFETIKTDGSVSYYLYNQGTGRYLKDDNTLTSGATTLWVVNGSQIKSSNNKYISVTSSGWSSYRITAASNSGSSTLSAIENKGTYYQIGNKVQTSLTNSQTRFVEDDSGTITASSSNSPSNNGKWTFVSKAQYDAQLTKLSFDYPNGNGWSKITSMTNTNQYFYAIYHHNDLHKWSVALGDGTQQSGNKVMMFSNTIDPTTTKSGVWEFVENGDKYNIVNANYPEYFMQHESDPLYYAWRASDNGGGTASWGATSFTYSSDSWQINSPNSGQYIGPWNWESKRNTLNDEFASNRAAGSTLYDIYQISRGQYFKNQLNGSKTGDATYLITNSEATLSSTLGWTMEAENNNISYIFQRQNNGGLSTASGSWFFEAWSGSGNLSDRKMSQTIIGLPSGIYTLKVITDNTADGAYLFANDESIKLENGCQVQAIVGEGASLTFGVELKDYQSNWVIFDKFELIYDGNKTDRIENKCHYYIGDWSSETNNIELTDDMSALDVTGAAGTFTVTATNPNGLVYNKTATVSGMPNNVIVNGTCAKLVLTDGHPFHAPSAFKASYAKYTMTATAGDLLGTLMLPFNASLPSGGSAYSLTDEISMGESVTGTSESGIVANKPVVVTAKGDYIGTNVDVAATTSSTYTVGYLTGVYQATSAPEGSYVLQNHTTANGSATNSGVAFYYVNDVKPTVNPFRAYIPSQDNPVKAIRVLFDDGESTVINSVDGGNIDDAIIYSVNGTKRNSIQKGVNILKMSDGKVKKVIVK